DLNGHSAEALLAALGKSFAVEPAGEPVRPTTAGEFGMYVAGRWYRLTIRRELIPANDPIGRLPITLLARHVIEPIFGVTDPHIDKRIDFVGGGRGLAELERRVTSGDMAAAFALYPTQITDLMAGAAPRRNQPPQPTRVR